LGNVTRWKVQFFLSCRRHGLECRQTRKLGSWTPYPHGYELSINLRFLRTYVKAVALLLLLLLKRYLMLAELL
jgi:hypothetical protein